MVADGLRPSVGAPGQAGGLGGQVTEDGHHRRMNLDLNVNDARIRLTLRPLVINEVLEVHDIWSLEGVDQGC
ncbi:hypothetical protein KFK09_002408 [Dendrobium nobile]|uniref:Uncharacterized protein n=1 Tax=Dendrobium nobile TaxID=94219 RepID=A0A8T3C701_DENNO|nr:hypothetical protein KFK09_002408 [Dendrobium nobile]